MPIPSHEDTEDEKLYKFDIRMDDDCITKLGCEYANCRHRAISGYGCNLKKVLLDKTGRCLHIDDKKEIL